MTFLNKKEETFDLVMTEIGRKKLAMGKFKPHSYAFYDNEVVYNKYNKQELQNDIQPRIKAALTMGEQTTWDDTIQDSSTGDKDPLKYPKYFELGGYEYIQPYKPAWKIYVKEGEITGTIKQIPLELEKNNPSITLDEYGHDKIPQLNVFCEYKVYETIENGFKRIYIDRSSDDMKFEVIEENSFDDSENFILEVFQYSNGYKDIKKLIFVDEKDPISQNNVEHFFNIYVDDQEPLAINYSKDLEQIEKATEGLKDECE
jgi:hypothetical protein